MVAWHRIGARIARWSMHMSLERSTSLPPCIARVPFFHLPLSLNDAGFMT